jgi:tRNA (guanine-N7-)-methyltransferase
MYPAAPDMTVAAIDWALCPTMIAPVVEEHSMLVLTSLALALCMLCHAVLCYEQMGKVRVRQHVNPLSAQFQRPTPALDWAQVFKDPSRPLFVVSSARQTLLVAQHKHLARL